jgi:uncharacterized membrane protein YhaH (DUF805 family)
MGFVKFTFTLFRSFACLSLLTSFATAFAQRANDSSGCAACGGLLFFIIAVIVFNIAILVWVARDAKNRGMDSSILWMLLVFFTSFIGLIIYILARPQGNLAICPNCKNKKLQASVKCPHCGFATV